MLDELALSQLPEEVAKMLLPHWQGGHHPSLSKWLGCRMIGDDRHLDIQLSSLAPLPGVDLVAREFVVDGKVFAR